MNLRERKHLLFPVILVVALVLRLYMLDARPYHHDESIHAWFTMKLLTTGEYVYSATYHGPFQYFATAAIFKLFGPGDWAGRLLPALFGVGLVGLAYPLRRYLGTRGYLLAAFFLATSPTLVYYSRFFRNDVFVAFFSLAAVIMALEYLRVRAPREKDIFPPGTFYLTGAAMLLALSLTAKENTYITLFIFTSFTFLYARPWTRTGFKRAVDWTRENLSVILTCVVGALFVHTLFYTSFYTNPLGIEQFFSESIGYWWSQHQEARIGGPFYYYVPILLLYELPLVVFGVYGAYRGVRDKNAFPMFFAYWAGASFLIYSYVQEKVPWLLVHIVLPLAILAAWGAKSFIDRQESSRNRDLAIALLLVLIGFSLYQGVLVNYVHPADPREPLVYVQTSPDLKDFVERVDDLAYQGPGKHNLQITVVKTDYWPLPWYLRDYDNVGYYTGEIPALIDTPVVVTDMDSEEAVREHLQGNYERREYALREWHTFKPADINPKYLLYRRTIEPNAEYTLVVFYRG